jgi:2-keto-4-pentenoate hydratase/2-oxohepta-3-ene-1,7-dioic acid hydratase in catechol pathway
MKLVTYEGPSGPIVGELLDGEVFDLGFDGDMVAFIEAGAPVARREPVGTPRLLAPLRPRSLRDFLSFEGHMNNLFGRLNLTIAPEWYEIATYYKGMPDTVIGPEEEIPWPYYAAELDYELELAAVIGRPGKDIAADEASAYIFGYTIWNDVSARDVQAREMAVGMGPGKTKDWDGGNVLGPCLVTADELDPRALAMRVRVNGDVWGEESSGSMYRRFEDLVEYASQAQTLYPGEVFGSGTAAGGSACELGRKLSEGDMIELEIEGIGVLRNRLGRRAAMPSRT